ncbi:SDR family NAD(P)-dependent oxidoreductase [Streptomyces sp. WAC06614]|uniref:SDR family NAD(P)-dependent oxidoreductase n=1 Tax=Streptomyces sp. WAC06614 TaxID=2487416 RepID=UPI00163B955F|nr:SDR family oxidoreductase [Streptomyces sp. WAC06614]
MNAARKVAIVVGGTAADGRDSIGAALCHFLRDQGALVLPVSSRGAKVEATLRALGADTALTPALTADASRPEDLERTFDEIVSRYGRIDILVNAQGIAVKKPTLDMGAAEWEEIIAVNLLSAVTACRLAAARMIPRGTGHIVNIASGTALRGYAEVAAYGTTKGALVSLTRHLACEWAQHGLSVNALVPGYFVTAINREMLEQHPERLDRIIARTPARRVGDAAFEDLRAPLTYLTTCTPFVNGQTVVVDGGYCMAGSG